ncbi:hypothetical protein [Deinococcus daejeonensis]|nr:hypothetical protein [Deinococcus daejeonensis]
MDFEPRHWPGHTPLTVTDLVDFGDSTPPRLPTALVRALAELRHQGVTRSRAHLTLATDETQPTAHLALKIAPHMLRDPNAVDAIYETLEGTSTERLAIRVHLTQQNVPERLDIAFDAAELLDTTTLSPLALAPAGDAWLVTTMDDLFQVNFQETDALLDVWLSESGLPAPRLFERLVIVSGRQKAEHHAVELPEVTSLAAARDLAERISTAFSFTVNVVQAPRQDEPEGKRASLYESARDMARRLRQ